MVILDDRLDVWQQSPRNVMVVEPYRFFRDVPDVNYLPSIERERAGRMPFALSTPLVSRPLTHDAVIIPTTPEAEVYLKNLMGPLRVSHTRCPSVGVVCVCVWGGVSDEGKTPRTDAYEGGCSVLDPS